MNSSTPGLPVHHQLPEFTQTHVHRVSDAIQPSHPLSSPSLLPPNPPSIRVFSNESTLCRRWPKYWSFSFSISPSSEYSGLISFRIDWFAVNLSPCSPRDSQESSPTPQFKSISSSALHFLIVQLSHPYMTTEKTIAFTRWTFVGKVMSLLFNIQWLFIAESVYRTAGVPFQ